MNDVVALVLIKTEDITTVFGTLYGSAVWDGLIFCEQKIVGRRIVAGLLSALDDVIDLSQDECRSFEDQPGVDIK